MKVITKGRLCGKTHDLVQEMKRLGRGILIAMDESHARRIREHYDLDEANYKVVSFHDLQRIKGLRSPLFVDDADMILESIFQNPIYAVSINGSKVEEKLNEQELEKIESVIKLINHHITMAGGKNHGSLLSAIKILQKK